MPMERSRCKESTGTNCVQFRGTLEYEMGDAHMAIQARLMNKALHKLSHSLYNTYHLYISGIKLLRYMLLSSLQPSLRDQFIGGKA
ncbi:hypothetical protein HID58_070706 [Brassica napus]|uniref:Uncharacterized protein n=2 Tax=Brassica napus TaxID=3708 RepID=A0ABQ7YZI2_BRANA|nr:hypothetical protein HID58_070706 [Brassica napus]